MAAPSFVDAGTGAADAAGAWSYTCQASAAAGRVFIVQLVQDGATDAAVTVTGATNIENLAGTDNAWTQIPGPNGDGSWPIGSATQRQFLYIGRALSTSAPTISGGNSTSEDLFIRSYQFNTVNTGTALSDVIENTTAGVAENGTGSGTTVSDTAVTTLYADRLALQFVGLNDDVAIDAFAGMTGGTWAEAVAEYASAAGTDAALQLQTALIYSLSQETTGNLAKIGSSADERYMAQSFQLSQTTLVPAIELFFGVNVGSPTAQLTLQLRDDSSGVPNNVLASATIAVTASSWNRWDFASPWSVEASTKYWIVVRRDDAGFDASNHHQWAYATSNVYANGDRKVFIDPNWIDPTNPTFDQTFRIHGKGSIDGGSDTIVTAGWGVVGFALIGTTVEAADLNPNFLHRTTLQAVSRGSTW